MTEHDVILEHLIDIEHRLSIIENTLDNQIIHLTKKQIIGVVVGIITTIAGLHGYVH